MPGLAIVIPAFKGMFFRKTLLSISNQTCKDFTLYIGDDASSFNFRSLVDEFQHTIRIKYTRFIENTGGKDLIAQWERCVDLMGDEEWVWMFSDDDRMDPDCVQNFYAALGQDPDFDVFHFNVIKIDEYENQIERPSSFPPIMTSEEFLKKRLSGGLNSTVVEYIFRKAHFLRNDRFQRFDLAWGSDDATWMKLAKGKGIKTIENGTVYWRRSPFNISPNYQDWLVLERKFNAELDFIKWVFDRVATGGLKMERSSTAKLLEHWFLQSLRARINAVSSERLTDLLKKLYLTLEGNKCPPRIVAGLFLFKSYSFVKLLLKRSMSFASVQSSADGVKS